MSKKSKPSASEKDGLLDELNSIQSLLGDAAQDVPSHNISDGEDIPLLPTEDNSDHAEGEGDAHAQIPLLGTGTPTKTPPPTKNSAPPRQTIDKRENPFLSKASATKPSSTPASSKSIENLIAQRAVESSRTRPAAKESVPVPVSALDDTQVRTLVDEVLAAWMPKIERELRNLLIERLKVK